jgi:hypothetical protein
MAEIKLRMKKINKEGIEKGRNEWKKIKKGEKTEGINERTEKGRERK